MTQEPFSYHQKLTAYFKNQPKTWQWFMTEQIDEKRQEEEKVQILQNTYKLPKEENIALYDLVEQAKRKLGIIKEVILYQELDSISANASISYFGELVNIVFSGDVLKRFTQNELLSIIAHELSHILFDQLQNGELKITNKIIHSISIEQNSTPVISETARLYRLYNELFCDRGSYFVTQNIEASIGSLVKMSSNLQTVNPKEYLKQAYQAVNSDYSGSKRVTHPESFIRAIALDVFSKNEDDEEITKLIEANWSMNKLDIFKQQELSEITEQFIELICKPKWIRSDSISTLCRQYFPTFNYNNDVLIDEKVESLFDKVNDSIREYFSYILLDFSFADSSLELLPLGHSFEIAEQLNFHKTFRQILKKETKITVKEMDKRIKKAVLAVSELSEGKDESILKEN